MSTTNGKEVSLSITNGKEDSSFTTSNTDVSDPTDPLNSTLQHTDLSISFLIIILFLENHRCENALQKLQA